MATPQGDRTEKPTARKLKEARERGQVPRSRDLSAALSLAATALAIGWLAVRMAAAVGERLSAGLSTFAERGRGVIEINTLVSQLWTDAGTLALVSGPPAIIAGAVSVAASLAQSGWTFSPKAMQLNWGRLSPAQGAARFAPIQSLPELVKAVVGMAAVGVVCYLFVRECYVEAPRLMSMSAVQAGAFAWDRVAGLLWRASLALLVLAGGDYAWQRWRWMSGLKMTRQEVRDDARMQDGSPEIKARVRRIQRDMSRRRMLHAVKTATVVVTNPTHFAVALQYKRQEMAAPIVVAKGQDAMAARIRRAAREAGVPMVENVTLARALYKNAEIGDAIPASLFGAVAEVLAYLVRLKNLVL